MPTTDPNQIAPPDDPLQTSNPTGMNGGLVSNPPTATPPPAPTAPTYQATTTSSQGYLSSPYVVPKEGTVQEQVKNIVANDSPLLQQAKQRAEQQMLGRGLINSSLAIGAGHEAVIAQALPIAQQDAKSYADAATNTTNQQNAASQFNAGSENQIRLANSQAQNAASANNQQSAVQLIGAGMTQQTQYALANLDTKTRFALTNFDAQSRQLLQTNQSASNAYVQAVTNIANITQSNTMNQEAKDRAVQTQMNLLNEQLRTIGAITRTETEAIGSLNLGEFFGAGSYGTTPPPAGAPTTATPPPISPTGSNGVGSPAPQPTTAAPPQFVANPQVPGQFLRQIPIPKTALPNMPYLGEQQYITEEYGRGFKWGNAYYPTLQNALDAMQREADAMANG